VATPVTVTSMFFSSVKTFPIGFSSPKYFSAAVFVYTIEFGFSRAVLLSPEINSKEKYIFCNIITYYYCWISCYGS